MNTPIINAEKDLGEMLNDCSIDAIIAVDTGKNIIAWNATAEKSFGKKKDDVIGKPVFEVIPSMNEDEEILKAVNLALKGFKSFVPASKKYYHRKHAENHFIPLKDADTIIGVMNLVHDVAHRIKAEEQLQYLNEELERRYRQLKLTAEELASFTYITSSKIKEPIRQIYTGVEHLIKIEAGRLSDTGKASFRRMQTSLNRMDLLLNDVLSVAQISILQKPETIVDLDEVVKKVKDDMADKIAENNAVVEVGDLCEIKGYTDYLYILLRNLVDNAIKFNESAKPAVKIDCKKVFLYEDETEPLHKSEYYCVSVSDNGIGFEQNDSEKIFTMFEKLHDKKYKGSGIGLTIARKIMQAHNGFITAESNGCGSAFHCFFPAK